MDNSTTAGGDAGGEHTHDHDHGDHSHDAVEHENRPPSYFELMETVVRELLIEKGLLSADEIRRAVELMDSRSPANGARLVARAWLDPGFKQRLLANGKEACKELGIDFGDVRLPTDLVVVENTKDVHNVIVCTLCSCYPRLLMGLPPDWYKSREYRARTVREPREVLREFGTVLPDDVTIRVHDSNADMRYLVLPLRPEHTDSLSEDELAAIVTRDSMIGVTTVKAPSRSIDQ